MAKAESLAKEVSLNGDFSEVRRQLVSACGLKNSYQTGHCFGDYNHVDCCTMQMEYSTELNNNRVAGMHATNPLAHVINPNSIQDSSFADAQGGSWCTCHIGAGNNKQDVCHIQFQSKIGFKLVWCGADYDLAILVDDDGVLINSGKPTGSLPPLSQRQANYRVVQGSLFDKCSEAAGSS
ncbi:unnamed protein product [Vitrella brassicaformis CCMP3155]|uniref:Uncharacterized protein n=1 Tax=Vitrella brassicaformis (strain CCMP3155) TaxID=1169540 RepID=A0A0G4ETU8_VITBC|nr:unnamed protein product [Vitrella brassicaformis CCMP3155]|eukprot:CEM02052.1 unnamed protein product [Vitrella brassicaformis CCMP3155]